MKAVDKVYKIIKDNYADKWTDTMEIAEKADLSRSVISIYLSQLYKKGKLTKKNGRPVLWKLSQKNTPFSNLIGYSGSLKEVVKKCQESIVYPPNGFPLIITGPSGVGKSFLAKNIYNEAKKLGAISEDAKFITLNAADYANNPELLSSVLFRYKKGAFTGANVDTLGLIDRADNGYFFLDEIHRLPKESQEKLFSLLDSGQFYPLGENDVPHKVNVRFVFATTEKLDNFLLKTFMRRVPLHVSLPSFKDRPLTERLSFIFNAFKNESIRVDRKFLISNKVIEKVSKNSEPGNVGAMENDVKLLCASAYTQHPEDKEIHIGDDKEKNYVIVDKDFDVNNYSPIEEHEYGLLSNVYDSLLKMIDMDNDIQSQKLLLMKFLKNIKSLKDESLINSIAYKMKAGFKNTLKKKYGIELKLDDTTINQIAFGISLYYFIDDYEFDTSELISRFESLYPRTMYIYKQFLSTINTDEKFIDMSIMWLLLIFNGKLKEIESIKYTGIILAHGDSTATSIQSVVNNLCGNYIFEAFDMPIDVSIQQINSYVQNYIQNQKDHDHKQCH